ncbi:ubiquitin carboxyl-terminal hydrolase 4-like isoform X2 [Rhodnius prolixus]|uniref:ubiquitin carboxyl-terminal hydrolase 4-like isoform X2 n=1 Tax=Rhodnius prolixus TaxID=13249 RepID=UPI003D188BEF
MGELIDIPTPEEQKETMQMLLTKSLLNGETWYLIYSKWMSCFKQFIGLEKTGGSPVSHPGPIDNSNLLDEEGELRKALVDKMDYEVVPAECWNLLVQWYGLYKNQQPVSRKVIMIAPSYLSIEVYPVELKCFKNAESKKPTRLIVSKEDSLSKLNNDLKKMFNINQNTNTRLLLVVGDGVPFIPNLENTVAGIGLTNGSTVIIETMEDGGWPRTIRQVKTGCGITAKNTGNSGSSIYFGPSVGASSSTLSFAGGGRSSRTSTMGSVTSTLGLRQPGVCGLNNLGNTCFMNSVLQCMSNCPPITDYFLAGKHLLELNETNPLGMKGEIARVYGELIQAMWSGNYATANPLPFKIQVGKFNPTFSGCQQHDSQELLTFLLDGLHEDLNRIKKKPYIEVKDQIGRPDCVVANEAWDNYRKRNDSIIVDTFHGLLKSRVVCPECERVSVTFDPFCYLSLPLPLKKDRVLTVRYIPFDGYKRENSFRVSVPRKGIVRDLCQEISYKVGCSADQLLVAEIAHCHFHKFYCNEDSLDNIDEKDVIFVYQLPVLPVNVDEDEDIIVPVCFWEKVKPVDRFAQNHLFGVPFLAAIPRRPISSIELNSILKEKMRRHFVFYNEMDAVNDNTCNRNDAGSSQERCFPLFTMDTTRATPNPQPLEFVNGVSNIRDIMEENYHNRYFGRMILIVQMTAEERRELYREKPAEYGPDLMLSQSNVIRDKNARINIEDCISLFTTCEKLSADDAWYCPACRKHQRATKKFDLWKLPKILIIHLKRFSYTRCRRDKIDSLVDFPLNDLNISNYVINTEGPRMKYDLIGVCNHYGHMGGGHYTAYCKNKNTKEWYCFDDNSVSIQSEEKIMSSAAYVLFYMAKETTTEEHMEIN